MPGFYELAPMLHALAAVPTSAPGAQRTVPEGTRHYVPYETPTIEQVDEGSGPVQESALARWWRRMRNRK